MKPNDSYLKPGAAGPQPHPPSRAPSITADLARLASDYKLFADSCTLMHPRAGRFFKGLLSPALECCGAKLFLLRRVVEEVQRLQTHPVAEKAACARRAASLVQDLIGEHRVDIRGQDSDDKFPDCLFLQVFTTLRRKHNLAIVTQDRDLAHDIVALNHQRSVSSEKAVRAFRLNDGGDLAEWVFRPQVFKFRVCDVPDPDEGAPLPIAKLPEAGDFVDGGRSGRVRLDRHLAEGGEGRIFKTADGRACKIYFADRLTSARLRKLELMVAHPAGIPGVCWPEEIARDGQGRFCGYLMPAVRGVALQKSVFHKALLARRFPCWTRRHLVQLGLAVLEKIRALHERNVLVGDLNPLNILVESERDVFLVDTDSFQVEAHPCPVGMVNFTAAEIQGRDFRTFLRTDAHENFAVATLLFMLLMPGKPPFSHQGGGTPGENIRARNFSYPLGEKSNKKTPEGPWRFMWSNLPYRTKEAFFDCFAENRRPSVPEWMGVLHHYLETLEHGHVTDEIYPTAFKPVSSHAQQEYGASAAPRETFVCSSCRAAFEVDADKADRIRPHALKYCYSCMAAQRSAAVEFRCDACGLAFTLLPDQAERMQQFAEKLCRGCADERRRERETGVMRSCADCGGSFLFSFRDQKFYLKRGYEFPKRCPDCRKSRKARAGG